MPRRRPATRGRVTALLATAFLALAPAAAHAATGTVSTVAGTGTAGFAGDGGPATAARLSFPIGLFALPAGGYLIADQVNHRVRRVAPDGTITTVAGNGTAGLAGDGGPATAAQLSAPSGVAQAPDGTIYVADANNNRIRRVAPGGTITTFAGSGGAGVSGDGGPATSAQLSFPFDVEVTGDGSVLIADVDNHRIRRVSPGGTITTVAGSSAGLGGDGGAATSAQLSGPRAVAPTADGGFLIADRGNHRIRRVSPGGTITTVAGTGTAGLAGDGGPATAAKLQLPSGVTVEPGGGYLIADTGNHVVRRVTPGGVISTVAGIGTACISSTAACGDGGAATAAQLNQPLAAVATADGDVLVADTFDHRIRRLDVGDAGPPAVLTAPTLAGTPKPGQTLTCQPGAYTNGPVTLSYVWELAPRTVTAAEDPAWQAIGGDTAATHLVRAVELAFRIRCREIAVNGAGTATAPSRSLRVDADVPRLTPGGTGPSVNGPAVVGRTLTCLPGDFENPGDFDYTWIVNGLTAGGGPTFTPDPVQRGFDLRCGVRSINDLGTSTPLALTPSQRIILDVPRGSGIGPRVQIARTGGRATDVTATCAPGGWSDDEGRYGYEWLREGTLVGGVSSATYTVGVEDLGRIIQCRVTATNALGTSSSRTSPQRLIALPGSGTEGRLFAAVNGVNWLSSTSMLALSAEQLAAMRPLIRQRFLDARQTARDGCASSPARLFPRTFDSTYGRVLLDNSTCWVLLTRPNEVVVTDDGLFWRPQPCVTTVPFSTAFDAQTSVPGQPKVAPPERTIYGFAICPKLRVQVPAGDTARARELDASVALAAAAAAPVDVLWDFDGNGRVDASCGSDAPVLRTIPSRGTYPNLRAVIVNRDSETSGVYGSATLDFDFGFGVETRGSVRSAQPFACRPGMDAPKDPKLPCVREATIGRVRLEGNLCPVASRDVPAGELGALDRDVRSVLESKVLSAPASALRSVAPGGELAFTPRQAFTIPQQLSQAAGLARNIVRIADPPIVGVPALKVGAVLDNAILRRALKPASAAFAADQIYVADGTVKVNGVSVDPIGTAATVLVPTDAGEAIAGVERMAISSARAQLAMLAPDGKELLPLTDPRPFSAELVEDAKADAQTFARDNFDKLAADLRSKLDIGPFKFADGSTVRLEKDGTASIHASATLPIFTDPVTGKSLRAAVDIGAELSGRLTLKTIQITAPTALLGPITLRNLDVRYDGGLEVKGQIILGPGGDGIDITQFRLNGQGRFDRLGLKYLAGVGRGIPIGPGLFLTQIGGEFQNPPPGLQPGAWRITAYAAMSAGTSVGSGCPAVGLVGDVSLNWKPGVFAIDARAEPSVACVKIGSVDFHADTSGYVSVLGQAKVDLGLIKASGTISGDFKLAERFKDSRFQVAATGNGQIVGLLDGTVKTIVSNLGVAGCGSITVVKVPLVDAIFGKTIRLTVAGGAGVRFPGGVPPLTYPQLVAALDLFTGCDLSDYQTFAQARAAASGSGRILPVSAGQRLLSLSLTGTGGVPRVKLTTPDGRVLDYTQVPDRLTAMPTGSSAMAIPGQNRLVVLLAQPQAGNWRVEPVDGSPALADLQTARALPKPNVSVRVQGLGARRVLRWSVARLAGQSVRFSERGGRSLREIATVKGGGRGSARYVVGESSGTRTIVAAVSQDGLPREELRLARYRAAAPRVGRVTGVRVLRLGRGGRLRVSWRPASLAAGYLVGVRRGSGRDESYQPTGARRSVVLTGVGARERLVVRVRGVSAAGRRGPGTTLRR